MISGAISGIIYAVSKSWELSLGCFLSGILIDMDHIIDYIREYGFPFRIKSFFNVCNTSRFNKLVLIFHGWEWVILIGLLAWYSEWPAWLVSIATGFSLHLALDTFSNARTFRSYFFLWRLKMNFDHDIAFIRKGPHRPSRLI
ncbi:MAG: hypothetical protein C4560_02385 [Nitrospiraceae bacterium]|nr:MAG: hypothetical protein C4560_02385 [Nitrospiraceae bacterium]